MLAIDGGEKVRKDPFPKRHLFTGEERQAVAALFDRSIRTGTAFGYGGPEEQAYEEEFAQSMGGGYADLVNSGTSALYAALGALELEPAGEVVVPAISDFGGVMPAALLNQVPLSPSYGRIISDAVWFRERRVFGTSDYPWGLPDYEGDRDAQYACPNAREAIDSHFVIRLHEAWGDREAADAAAAIRKVEAAYLR